MTTSGAIYPSVGRGQVLLRILRILGNLVLIYIYKYYIYGWFRSLVASVGRSIPRVLSVHTPSLFHTFVIISHQSVPPSLPPSIPVSRGVVIVVFFHLYPRFGFWLRGALNKPVLLSVIECPIFYLFSSLCLPSSFCCG